MEKQPESLVELENVSFTYEDDNEVYRINR